VVAHGGGERKRGLRGDPGAIKHLEEITANEFVNTENACRSLQLVRAYLQRVFRFSTAPSEEISFIEVTLSLVETLMELAHAGAAEIAVTEQKTEDFESLRNVLISIASGIFLLVWLPTVYMTVNRSNVFQVLSRQPFLIPNEAAAALYDEFKKVCGDQESTPNYTSVPIHVTLNLALLVGWVFGFILHVCYLLGTAAIQARIAATAFSAFNLCTTTPTFTASFVLIIASVVDPTTFSVLRPYLSPFLGAATQFDLRLKTVKLSLGGWWENLSSISNLAIQERGSDTSQGIFLRLMSSPLGLAELLMSENISSDSLFAFASQIASFKNPVQSSASEFERAFHWNSAFLLPILIFVSALYILAEIRLLWWAISYFLRVRRMITALVRVCTLLPSNSPFTELTADGRIDFCREVPDMRQAELIDVFPIGILFTDSAGRVVRANRQALEIFGHTPLIGIAIAEVPRELGVGEDTHFLEIQPFPGTGFLVDESGRDFEDPRPCFIVTDVTRQRTMVTKEQKLAAQIHAMREQLVPKALQTSGEGSQTVLGDFAVVDLRFVSPEEDEEDVCGEFMADAREYVQKLKTCKFLSPHRWSYYAVFGTESSERGIVGQAMSETFQFVQRGWDRLGAHVKMAISTRQKCYCQIDTSDRPHFTMYSRMLPTGASLLRACHFGAVICDGETMAQFSERRLWDHYTEVGRMAETDRPVGWIMMGPTDDPLADFGG
jgi:PAS domain-containing protein